MKMIPKMYNSEHDKDIIKLSTRCDKMGNIFHCVEYHHPRNGSSYVTFEKLASALDFIHSNFRAKL